MTAKDIVTSEDIDMYTCIFQVIISIEPKWKINKLEVIYADTFITQRLLRNLSIEDACFLHGDYFHLMREVCP